jgi:hypothetical protein
MSQPKIDESKFKYLNRNKLHRQYLTNFLTEIWNVPLPQLSEFIEKFYPNPSALELVELNELKRYIRLNTVQEDADGNEIEPQMLSEEDKKWHAKRHERMYGKEVQPIELAGSEGKAIELTSMSREQVNAELQTEMAKVLKVMTKVKNPKKKVSKKKTKKK